MRSLQQRLVRTGGRLIKHASYYWLLPAESHLTRRLVRDNGAQDGHLTGGDGFKEAVVANSEKKEAGDGEVSVELTEKMGLAGAGVLRQRESRVQRSRGRIPAAKTAACRIKGWRLGVHSTVPRNPKRKSWFETARRRQTARLNSGN
jgi:hypothetical protein